MSTLQTTLQELKTAFEELKATTSDPEALEQGKLVFCRSVVEAYLAAPPPPPSKVDDRLEKLAPVLAALDEGEREAYVARLSEAWGPAQTEPVKAEKGKGKPKPIDPRLHVQAVVRALGLVVDGTGAHYLRMGSTASPIESTTAKAYIAALVQGEHSVIVGSKTIDDAVLPLLAESWPVESLPIRIGGDTTKVVIDLANGSGEAIVITADEEPAVVPSPILFTHLQEALPLPRPIFPKNDEECAAAFDELWTLLRVQSPIDRAAVFAWLMASARRGETYPLLACLGPKDSGKTNKALMVRSIVDPVRADKKGLPEKIDDIVVGVREQHVAMYDNVSKISLAQSDTLCLLLTGGAWSKRKLHTNGDNYTTKASRPLMITAIVDVITQSDLLSRSLIWRHGVIKERVPEDVLAERFARLHPRILGAVCYAIQAAIRSYKSTVVDNEIRLLGCAQWAAAGEQAAGFAPGAVSQAYEASHLDAQSIESEDPVVAALVKWMSDKGEWRGTASDLLEQVEAAVYSSRRPPRGWPESPRGLSQAINRHTKLLGERGIEVEREHSTVRTLTLRNATAKVDIGDEIGEEEILRQLEKAANDTSKPAAPAPPQIASPPPVPVDPIATISDVPPGRHALRVTNAGAWSDGYAITARCGGKEIYLGCRREHLRTLGVLGVPDAANDIDESGTVDVMVEVEAPPPGSRAGATLRRTGLPKQLVEGARG